MDDDRTPRDDLVFVSLAELHRKTTVILRILAKVHKDDIDLKEILMSTQDTINADTQAIQQAVTELNSAKATLRAEFDALVAANPTIDTSGLGAAVAALEPAVQAVAGVGPAPAVQIPPIATSGGAIPQPATTTPGDPGPQPPVDPAAPVA
jgi:hypothetical protein